MSAIAAESIEFSRAWAMPSHETFQIPPIARLLDRWVQPHMISVDPFARNSSVAKYTNDLNGACGAGFSLDAREYLKAVWMNREADALLLDPPYSPRQIKECYESVGLVVTQSHTQHAKLVSETKDLAAPIVRTGGIVICFGWNSSGMGKSRGFSLLEVLLVAHGGSHNDTIVTVERKELA